ncbi:Ferric-uptake regulator [Fulvimarina pelagi HTCC2506]|uniref:Ferric-uptake regulator n=2 Tax=Fulvimarina pelagi TaxID=217511 RepID=Q0G2X3_9HYPH|nr:Fur family transcriptional regulator [Fulvimarina pelagi]EAU42058.1 Ferric-uptake regulator [Fulvimarina pelagi HTCC2506]BAT31027.1 ferric-uptake regulator [Fulvimarina pelagi]
MTKHTHSDAGLTKNQSLVMNALNRSDGPLSAYTILDQLRDKGFRAPLQVYRALDKLVDSGLVHRLESLNAFVACRHTHCGDDRTTTFMICETCGQVTEISDGVLADQLQELALDAGFALRKSIVELRGTCRECSAA